MPRADAYFMSVVETWHDYLIGTQCEMFISMTS
jgi:hypothetical protein